MVYFLVSILVITCSFFLFKKSAGSLAISKPNMISYIFYYDIFLQTFIAAVLIVLFVDNHYVISRVSDSARFNGWLAVVYLVIAFPVGMLLSSLIFRGGPPVSYLLDNYTGKNIDIAGVYGRPLKYSIWIITVVSMFSCIYTFINIGYFPFLKVLTSSADAIAQFRISASRSFSGNVYVRNVLAISLMPLLSYVWVFYSLRTRAFLDRLMALFSVLFAASILYYDFSKAPLLWYILSFLFVYFYAFGKINLKLIFIVVSVVITILIVMYNFLGGESSFFSYNSGPVGRIILGQGAGFYLMLDIFPQQHDFIGFSSISSFLSNVFEIEYVDRAARITMADFNPKGLEEGTAGVMNSIFIAEAWANFGLFGVLISPLWVGFLIQTLYLFFLRSRKTPLHLAAFVSFSLGGSVTGGVNDYLYNGGLFMFLLIILIIMFLANVLASSRKEVDC